MADDSWTLVAVFASPVADYLIRYGADLGCRTVLVEPERGHVSELASDPSNTALPPRDEAAGLPSPSLRGDGVSNAEQEAATVLPGMPQDLDSTADIVVTDHHRVELGPMLRDALALPVRWVGVLGNPRHPGPHIAALTELGVPPADIDRVHRPVGLNIGSRTPPEIAIATLAGLIADRNGRKGGFDF